MSLMERGLPTERRSRPPGKRTRFRITSSGYCGVVVAVVVVVVVVGLWWWAQARGKRKKERRTTDATRHVIQHGMMARGQSRPTAARTMVGGSGPSSSRSGDDDGSIAPGCAAASWWVLTEALVEAFDRSIAGRLAGWLTPNGERARD
jgi:type II secretory pathway pseudopilin PulG